MAKRAPEVTTVLKYARGVAEGRTPACKLVSLAGARFLHDLERRRCADFPFVFDEALAERCVRFFGLLKHTKGEWEGESFALSPWQAFIVANVYGWVDHKTRLRRFRGSYTEVPRKNGKSTWAAGNAIMLAFFDDEPGAEVYCAATKRDQAKIIFGEAQRMIQKTPSLKKRLGVYVNNIHSTSLGAKIEPLGADADTLDGLNPHAAILDELHAHKNRNMVDVLETATGARRQPMMFYVTTAGMERESVCWQLHDYSVKVLERVLYDDTWFAYVAGIDQGDDWREPSTWAKANPNLGISVKLDDLARKAARAAEVPTEQNAFRRLHLNEWVEAAVRWLNMDRWRTCRPRRALEDLVGEPCFAAIDLAQTRDITALVLLFPDGADFDVHPFFFVPEEGMKERVKRDRVPYDQWVEQGLLIKTEGDVTDYDRVREKMRSLSEQYQIVQVAYDPWNATQLATQLQADGANLVKFRQNYSDMAAPTKEWERLVLEGALRHGDNAVLTWMASNASVKIDPSGAMRVVKPNSKESAKVDGIVAGIMSLGLAILHLAEPPTTSVYESRGIRVL